MPAARNPRIDSNQYRFLGVLESASDGYRRLLSSPAGLDDRLVLPAGRAGLAHALGRNRNLIGAGVFAYLTRNKTRFEPKRIRATVPLLFAFLGMCSVCVAAWMSVRRHGLSMDSLTQSAAIILVSVMPIGWLLLEVTRALSVELTEEGVECLNLHFRGAIGVSPRWIAATLPWRDVQKIGIAGHLIHIKGKVDKIVVNTLIFEKPAEVIEFINKSFERAQREVGR
jgi:hypothetical protein